MNLNLSGWSFSNWNDDNSLLQIETQQGVALNDVIVGSVVRDVIVAYAGDDTLQGGGGADVLAGDDGNDIFVFAANEAVGREIVDGGGPGPAGGTTDTVLVRGTNDFIGVDFFNVERLAFAGKATASFDQDFIGDPTATVVGNANANALVFQLQRLDGVPAIDLSQLSFRSGGRRTHDHHSGHQGP